MAIELASLADLAAQPFDLLIDARAPSEFAEDHLPGAVSMPVLSDDERARVGTLYKRSPFEARKMGAALVARNVAAHLEGPLADKSGGFRPLVYCWRGGQRSGSFATILREVGWRAETIEGGYRAWRRLVVARLYAQPVGAPVVVIDGNTGTAKTAILKALAARGQQVIDLEGLANHRGSLFGARAGGQPSQKMFERDLALAIDALDPARPVFVEAESSKVGDLALPPELWKAMCAAPRVVIEAPLDARANWLAEAYADITENPARLHDVIARLRRLHGAETVARWHGLAEARAFARLAAELMQAHYDPRYEKQRSRFAHLRRAQVTMERIDAAAIDRAAAQIEHLAATGAMARSAA